MINIEASSGDHGKAEDELREPTYIDFLTRAFAKTSSTFFESYSGFKWDKVIHDFIAGLADGVPDPIRTIYFEDRGDGPMSEEVNAFLGIMRRSKLLSVLSPDMRTYSVDPQAKRGILDATEDQLGHLDTEVGRLAAMLDARLGTQISH